MTTMTYLSRIRINPLRKDSRKLLSNPRAVHGAVMGGLPNHKPDDRVLWRMDPDNPHRPHLFVLSPTRPDWTHIIQDCGWPDADGDHAAVRDYTPFSVSWPSAANSPSASPPAPSRTPPPPRRRHPPRPPA